MFRYLEDRLVTHALPILCTLMVAAVGTIYWVAL
jgi:hypothetical protein